MTTHNRRADGMRWVLAFDAACGTCREISIMVERACDGTLEVLPLVHPAVGQWRERALGSQAPHAPTLLRVHLDGEEVRAWTGIRMAVPMARRLGPRASARVLSALGRLRQEVGEPLIQAQQQSNTVDRKAFLRFAAGAAMAGGLLVTGSMPAFAQERQRAAEAWVKANRHALPQTYRSLTTYSLEYRKEIYRTLPPETRAQLWREQLNQYRAQHRDLTAPQRDALDQAQAYLTDPKRVDFEYAARPATQRELDELGATVAAAFGTEETYAVVGTLGPAGHAGLGQEDMRAPRCSCRVGSPISSCTGGDFCKSGTGCATTGAGCGVGWVQPCNGICYEW
ncbi:bacteriocin fulvocin C-related protein [Streptomyces huasconensis]|uniref:bacteriocin fulvocin C-related protein n=1 Tax=Streptomyces huasconensis TaxID=1854574 RepID=UPI0033C756B1